MSETHLKQMGRDGEWILVASPQFKFWTIDQYRARRREVAAKWWSIGILAIACAVQGAFMFADSRIPQSPQPAGGHRAAHSINPAVHPAFDASWRSWAEAGAAAYAAWKSAGVDVPEFTMVPDADGCGKPEAIACWSPFKRLVFVTQDGDDLDRFTVMLHELGHAAGVPHIEGDPLMNAEYLGPVKGITPMALALAKLCAQQKVREVEVVPCPE